MRASLFRLPFLLTALAAPAFAQLKEPTVTVRLDEYLDKGSDWDFSKGQEFPGAKGTLAVAPNTPAEGQTGLKLTFDLTGGGKYVSLAKSLAALDVRDLLSLRMKIKTKDVKNLTFRITDSSGQTHQKKDLPIPADGVWHDCEFKIADLVGGEHWGGANDGQWHGPGKAIVISVTERAIPESKVGEILFGDLRAEALPGGDQPAIAYLAEDFDKDTPPANWPLQGDAAVISDEKFSGGHALRLARTREKFDAVTAVTTEAVPVRAGRAEFTGAFKSALESPDSSFNASVSIQALDGQDKVLQTIRVADFSGTSNWTLIRKQFEIPAAAARARLRIELNKATGQFWADKLTFGAPAVTAAPRSPIQRVILKTDQVGNMLYPGNPVVFDVVVETLTPLPENNRILHAIITDYWGAEQASPFACQLTGGERKKAVFTYSAKLDLSAFPAVTGKYYDLQTFIDGGTGDVVRESSSFVVLPEAVTKAYSWKDIPFSSRNWDNRLAPYFFLSDRLGIRLVGIWGGWEPKPPYKPSAPGYDTLKKLNVTMLTRTPIVDIEHHKPGYEAYTDEVLRDGVAPFFDKFDTGHDLVVTLGNEPQQSGPTVEANVKLYQLMYDQVKKVSPSTFVVGTSVGPAEEYFKLGFQKYSDAVDFHTYEDSKGLKETFAKYKTLFAKYGGEQPIWATEMGLNSQGLTRRTVAGEVIKKFAWFFCYGGQNASWFGICYPDREGKLRGASDDSLNVFNGLYGNYSPRLDAVAYYNIINAVCLKKFTDQRDYDGQLHGFLFLDKNGDNLQILWQEKGGSDVFLPLEGVAKVKVTRIDGTSAELDAGGKGINLHVAEDPILLTYPGRQKNLPRSPISVLAVPEKIIRGETVKLSLALKDITPADLQVSLPLGWKSSGLTAVGDHFEVSITAPPNTDARYVPIRLLQKGGDLELIVPVQGQLSAEIFPTLGADEKPTIDLVIRNNNATRETVDWKLSLLQQIPVSAGAYSLSTAQPADAYFADASEGRQTVEPQSEAHVRVPLAGVNPIFPYKLRGSVTDASGRTLISDRFVGGFVGVPKAHAPVKLDGTLDEADWTRSKPRKLDQEVQFRKLLPTSNWTGPDDLSAELRFLWDENYLYVGVKVKDDVFRNTMDGAAIWGGDGLQFLIDPARARRDKPGKYDYAMGIGTQGPVAWCYLSADGKAAPAGEAKDIIVTGTPAKDGTGGMTYEIAIPWSRLSPFQPGVGANLGMAVILNEDDGIKRDGLMTWFGDIQTKEVDPVGDLILTE